MIDSSYLRRALRSSVLFGLLALSSAALAQPEGTGEAAEGTGEAAEGTGEATGEPVLAEPGQPTEGTLHELLEESGVVADEPIIGEEHPATPSEAGETDAVVAVTSVPPVTGATAIDTPNDSGESITVSWTAPETPVDGYRVYMSSDGTDGSFALVGEVGNIQTSYSWNEAENGVSYWFRVDSVMGDAVGPGEVVGSASASAQWFNWAKMWIAILAGAICFFVIFFIEAAKRGADLFIRKIAGLEAIDEAIGRSTEMGRPILFVPGIMDMDNVQTLAGLTILGHVSKMVAEYDTEIDVPVSRSLVMTAGREVIQQAYLEAGRPDAYNDHMVHFLTDEQFGYVAGVNGIIVRDEPACCFYQGAFYAESLILAETGNGIGAIQIAGTAMPSQLPFFVAACDYTLIGEELFAASAYLSNDPQQLGSLKGQDVGKLIAMVAVVVGAVAATVQHITPDSGVGEAAAGILDLFHKVFGG